MPRMINKLLSTKSQTGLASWNFCTLYQPEKCAQVAIEMEKYNTEVVGLSKVNLMG